MWTKNTHMHRQCEQRTHKCTDNVNKEHTHAQTMWTKNTHVHRQCEQRTHTCTDNVNKEHTHAQTMWTKNTHMHRQCEQRTHMHRQCEQRTHTCTDNVNKEHTHARTCIHTHTCMHAHRAKKAIKRNTRGNTGLKKVSLKTTFKGTGRRAVMESKRQNSRFVQQRLYYWSKYCLKRSVLRLVLKAGREGLWRRVKGREFQICAAKKQKAQPPCCFLVAVWVDFYW